MQKNIGFLCRRSSASRRRTVGAWGAWVSVERWSVLGLTRSYARTLLRSDGQRYHTSTGPFGTGMWSR